jgi:capsular polysaccharide biosynthesis protein
MQLQDYARVLLKRGWMIIVLAVLAAGSAYGFSKLQTPIYRSTVTLSVLPSRPADWGQAQAIKTLLRNYVQQMESPSITQQVIDKLQLDMTPEKFVSLLNFNADEADFVIQIEARNPMPDTAAKMGQTLAETFVSKHNQDNLQIDQQDRILVSILRNATSPEIFSPKTAINTLAGAILGALIGLVLIFALEWIESDIVRAPEDVERHIGLTVLGSIPTMGEKGSEAKATQVRRRSSAAPTVCPHCGQPI